MAKSCRFCGAEMDDNAIKCPECEKLVPNAEIILDKQKQQKKKKITIIIAIIVCIFLIIGIIIVSAIDKKNRTGGNTYINVIDMNLSAMIENNPNKFLKSYPDFMRDMIKETLGSLTDDNFNEYINALNDDIIKVYGSNVSVSYNINEKSHLEDDVSQAYLQELFEYIDGYSIEDFPIEDAYQLTLEITFNGSVGTQTLTTNVAVMQFNDAWYLLNIINPINTQVDNQQG